MSSTRQFKKLDVRPLLKKGIDPYDAIREVLASLAAGQGLMLIAPFMPSPLIEKLASEGYHSRLERGKGTDWIVYFWQEEDNP